MKKNASASKIQATKDSHPLKEELFEIIVETMAKENISQGEVARRVGAQRYNINKIMQRKATVSMEFLLRIAESLGLQVELKFRKVKV